MLDTMKISNPLNLPSHHLKNYVQLKTEKMLGVGEDSDGRLSGKVQ